MQQRTEGQSEGSRSFETAQGRSVSHSFTERSPVRIQDVLELHTGEFYGQLVDSDFSSFKAQIKAQEPGPVPELVPMTTATPQEVKRNFMRIQDEIEIVIASQQKGADVATVAPNQIVFGSVVKKRAEAARSGGRPGRSQARSSSTLPTAAEYYSVSLYAGVTARAGFNRCSTCFK